MTLISNLVTETRVEPFPRLVPLPENRSAANAGPLDDFDR